MIMLPAGVVPAAVNPKFIDFGIVIRPSTAAPISRVDRPGSRWSADITLAPLDVPTANIVLSRLQSARSTPLRVDWPLLGAAQTVGGTPVVNGTGAGGQTLPVRGLSASAVIPEGWWINVVDASANRYLHQVSAQATANGSGVATVFVNPMIRAVIADGSTITIAQPTIEGLVTSAHEWPLTPDRLIPISFTIEEAT